MATRPSKRQAVSPEPRSHADLDAEIRRLHGEGPFQKARELDRLLKDFLATPEGRAELKRLKRDLGDIGPARTSARRATIADLPEHPRELIAPGDRVLAEPRDGEPIEGIVDRVARHHVWVRPHPTFAHRGITQSSIDWRERRSWRRFVRRAKGARTDKVYHGYGSSRAPMVTASSRKRRAKAITASIASIPTSDSAGWDEDIRDLIQPGTLAEEY
jgi:hypothetical protein